MCRHQKNIKTLCKIAEDVAPVGSARIAAGLFYKNEFISFGTNQYKTHPLQKKFSISPLAICIHAEISAIINATKRHTPDIISRSTLYVARMKWTDSKKKRMTQGLACPCEGCQKAIVAFDIKNVYYSEDNEGYAML